MGDVAVSVLLVSVWLGTSYKVNVFFIFITQIILIVFFVVK